MVETLTIEQLLEPDALAVQLANKYNEWQGYRSDWMSQNTELRKYLFATDTSQTQNSNLPWKNSTTRPKLTQIRDNLHANYKATLFPQSKWLDWEASEDLGPDAQFKKKAALNYMMSKLNHPESNFYNLIDQVLYDYIDTGNVFASGNNYVINKYENEQGPVITYQGPMIKRYSSYDIVMNPLSTSVANSPKFVKAMYTLGDLEELIDQSEEYNKDAYRKALNTRKTVTEIDEHSTTYSGLEEGFKDGAFRIDGFGSMFNYYASEMVELLTFYGDYYDTNTNTFHKNRIVTIMDRTKIILNIPNPTNNGSQMIRHVGWRPRPDNLYAMGPLHNLVGMQYRIDHLENMAADAMDLDVFKMAVIKGEVEPFEYRPLERILCGDDGDIQFIGMNNAVQLAESKIKELENAMEEMAGAPRQAMGFRTPGEKTKFEVQILENNANRIFLHKVAWFEQNFLEPLLNDMFEAAVRNIDASGETIMYLNDQGVQTPMEITKEDLNAKGRFKPLGARHFQEKANIVQNIVQLANTPVFQMIMPHISSWEMAKTMAMVTDIDKINPNLISRNIGLEEAQSQGQPGGPEANTGLPAGFGSPQ